MTMEVIPVVNTKTFDELRDGLKRAGEFSRWAHVDVSDETFTSHVSWGNANELDLISLDGPKIELHLMTKVNRNSVRKWLKGNVARVVVHCEATDELEAVIKIIKKGKREVGIALRRETSASAIQKFLPYIDQVLVLAVTPGPSGQAFDEAMIEKIKMLRAMDGKIKIEVDGGVNMEVGERVKNAGADVLVAASYIWGSEDPQKAFKELSEI